MKKEDTYLELVDSYIIYARIFFILTQTADGDAIAAATGDVVNINIVGSGFDSYAVVSALIYEVGETDVSRVHCVCRTIRARLCTLK